jgi:hypothetical protein
MRTTISVGAAAALCVAVFAVSGLAKTDTVTGQVISLSCYYQNHANVGAAGMVCAWATVKYEGNPVGILTKDGTVYQLEGEIVANDNAKMVPFLGKTVSITGEVTEGRGHMLMLRASEAKLSE